MAMEIGYAEHSQQGQQKFIPISILGCKKFSMQNIEKTANKNRIK